MKAQKSAGKGLGSRGEAREMMQSSTRTTIFRTCPPPLEAHCGGGEGAAFIDVAADETGQSVCGLRNRALGLEATLRFKKEQLPRLTNWQHWGKGEYVMGFEPGTHPPIGQAKARAEDTLITLAPGESRTYDLNLTIQ